jgi:hypothetical protein
MVVGGLNANVGGWVSFQKMKMKENTYRYFTNVEESLFKKLL